MLSRAVTATPAFVDEDVHSEQPIIRHFLCFWQKYGRILANGFEYERLAEPTVYFPTPYDVAVEQPSDWSRRERLGTELASSISS